MSDVRRREHSRLLFALLCAAGASLLILPGCQSSQSAKGDNALESAAADQQPPPGAAADPSAAGEPATEPSVETAMVSSEPQPAGAGAAQIQVAAAPGQCAIPVAGGPPAKPPRGADFGTAVAKNTGKAVQRGIIQQIGGRLGGGLGAAIAGNVAAGTIRSEQDIKGVWMITDGRMDCACEVSVDSLYKLNGKGADTGFSKIRGCTSAQMQQVANWQLGYSFTGYDSKFQLKAKDKKTVLATLNRDGIHYFSGTFADGTPVVMWRQGQTFHQLTKFNQSVK